MYLKEKVLFIWNQLLLMQLFKINYIQFLYIQIMITGGIKELLFTSDNHVGLRKDFLALPDGMYLENV